MAARSVGWTLLFVGAFVASYFVSIRLGGAGWTELVGTQAATKERKNHLSMGALARSGAGPADRETPLPGSALRFEPASVDLGPVDAGTSTDVKIAFAVVEPKRIRVRAVEPTCACTRARLTEEGRGIDGSRVLAIGEAGLLELGLEASQATEGERRASVRITTEEWNGDRPARETPEVRQYQVKIRYEIRRLVSVSCGSSLSMGTVSQGTTVLRTVTLTRTDGQPLSVEGVDLPDDTLRVVSEPSLAGLASRDLVVSTGPNLPIGPFVKTVKVRLSPAELGSVEFHVVGTCQGNVEVDPPGGLYFGVVESGSVVERSVRLRLREDVAESSLEVGAVRCEWIESIGVPGAESRADVSDAFRVKTHPRVPGREVEVAVSFESRLPRGPVKVRILVDTNLPSGPRELPLVASAFVR